MSRTSILITFLLLAVPGLCWSRQPPPLDSCNRLYHSASYQAAADCYLARAENETSPELLYNLGTASAQTGEIGASVLFYLRALMLAPADADTAANLARIRQDTGLFPPEPDSKERFFRLLSLSQWSVLGLAALLCYLVVSILQLRRHHRLSPARELACTLVCVALLGLGIAGSLHHYRDWQQSVVMADTSLLLAPFAEAESIGTIGQGRLVREKKRYGTYSYVTDETGRKGWIDSGEIERLLPADPEQ